jgi:hypothetical protein
MTFSTMKPRGALSSAKCDAEHIWQCSTGSFTYRLLWDHEAALGQQGEYQYTGRALQSDSFAAAENSYQDLARLLLRNASDFTITNNKVKLFSPKPPSGVI